MDKHYLENMIYNLEERKNLKKVEFTKDAVREVLEYLKILQSYIQQLKEKDEEIEAYQKLINDICNKFYAGSLNDLPKKITKQVCEKIRRGIDDIHFNGNHYGYIGLCETHELIDKIARGEA